MTSLVLLSCTGTRPGSITASGLNPEDFDSTINGKRTQLIQLANHSGMEVCLTNYGGRVVSITVPDKNGDPTDVVCCYDNIHQFADTLNSPSDYGSSVGRYANRIKDAKLLYQAKNINYARMIMEIVFMAEETLAGSIKYMTSLRKLILQLHLLLHHQMEIMVSQEL